MIEVIAQRQARLGIACRPGVNEQIVFIMLVISILERITL